VSSLFAWCAHTAISRVQGTSRRRPHPSHLNQDKRISKTTHDIATRIATSPGMSSRKRASTAGASASKNQKVTPNEPITFKLRGLQSDTRLTVFDQEFHVHSTILKANSILFRTFLDSADKDVSTKANGKFKYEWITRVDEDGNDWHLVCDNTQVSDMLLALIF
jgi:hypothetical protein